MHPTSIIKFKNPIPANGYGRQSCRRIAKHLEEVCNLS